MIVTKDIKRIKVVLEEEKRTNRWLLPLVWGISIRKLM